MIQLSLLLTALLFGGMVLYSFGFAAFVFNNLPPDLAGTTIRKAFPHFYVFVFLTSTVAAATVASRDSAGAAMLVAVAVTAVLSRQVLMPMINQATDSGAGARFKVLHTLSVAITLSHIVAAGYVVLRFARLL